MFLYANGCSFTWGDELANVIKPKNFNKELRDRWGKITYTRPPQHDEYWAGSTVMSNNEEHRLKYSWPGQLAELFNCKGFENDAFPGGSNERILRTTTDWILYNKDLHPDLLVVIGWTYHSRVEIWNEKYKCYKCYNPQTQGMDKDDKTFMDSYWKHTYNDYERISNYLQCVITLQTLLKYYEIDFLFFNAIQDLDGFAEFDLTIFDHLLKEIDRDRYFLLENGTFNTWDEEKEYPRGPRFHPLKEGHAGWAKVLYDYINENRLCND